MKPATLSVCMIVRDEEEMLGESLESVSGVADQLVVVDTGSTDATVEIARSHGAEVHHFQWIDDFAAARNQSIRIATANWILWLDADERVEPGNREVTEQLATALVHQNKWEEARSVLTGLPRPRPDRWRGLAGTALIKRHRFDEAIAYYGA